MVVDTSVFITILYEEPDWFAYFEAIGLDTDPVFSASSYLEVRIVILRSRLPDTSAGDFESLLAALQVKIVPVNEQQARIAAEAYQSYGKGRHPAALNFGDCFSYALAKSMGEPLLFKGRDFSQTDVLVASTA